MFQLKKLLRYFLILAFLTPSIFSIAHAPDQSYIYLRIYKESIGGRFEMTAKDMNKAMGLGLPDKLSLEIINPYLPQIQQYLLERSAFRSSLGTHPVRFVEPTVLNLEEMEDFVRFHFELENVKEVPDALDIDYSVLFEKDNRHRGMLIIEYNWKAGIVDNEALVSDIFSPSETTKQLSLTDASIWKGFVALVKLGMWHIWIGLDHILFLVALILPAVVRRRKEGDDLAVVGADYSDTWRPVARFKPAFIYIIKIITFFTIAHSITLALAALHNITPILKSKEWMIAFGFGLFHGFGFASVLGEKGLGGDFMVYSLLGFNIGVELGQVLIICMIFPFLFLMRKLKIYPVIIKYGSMLLILISIYWFIERGFDVDLPLGAYFWKAYGAIFG